MMKKLDLQAWDNIIDQDLKFEKRVMHPPDNEMNSLISFINSLIYTKVLSEIYKTQLNPTISYLHEPGNRRFSLALDVAEGTVYYFLCLTKSRLPSVALRMV